MEWEFHPKQPYIVFVRDRGWLLKFIEKFTDTNDNDWIMLTSSNPSVKPIAIFCDEIDCAFKLNKSMNRKSFWAQVILCPLQNGELDFRPEWPK